MYVVVRCKRCGNVYVSKADYKSSRCPRCGYRNMHRGLRVYASLGDALKLRYSMLTHGSV